MRIKTFQGRSLEELLPEIKAELGPGAVVVGQRTKVHGGVAGFFGTKVIEVTAADRMPSDDQLIDLEDQLMGNTPDDADSDNANQAALAERFAGAMKMGRQGGLDVTDTWDPAQDAELASEYGRVLEHAATTGYADLDVPVVGAAAAATSSPMAQARALADRTHAHVQQATSAVDSAVYAPQVTPTAQTYAPPHALPTALPAQTFAASVIDTPMQGYEPQAVPSSAAAASTVDAALRGDLNLAPAEPVDPMSAIDAAVDMIDLRAMAALRNVAHASRMQQQQKQSAPIDPLIDTGTQAALGEITEQLSRVGVDDDVVLALVDAATRHRRPFGGQQNVRELIVELVEETIDVRSGFPSTGRAYRMAVVGASSSGKSTVVAKIANGYRAIGMNVGIVSIIGADPAVAVIGDSRFNGLDVDIRYAATPEQAIHAAESLAMHDLVVVDTPGSTYLDADTFEQVQACLNAIDVDDVHVVVPLATSSREARGLIDAFRPMGANRMIVSRLDESRYIGQLLNFGFRLAMPMTFLSEGSRVDADLRAASARDIANRILPAN